MTVEIRGMNTDLSTREIQLLGGEMLTWSDLASPTGPFRSPLAGDLVTLLPESTGRILALGPHSVEILRRFAAVAHELDVLVRSYPDAQDLSNQLSGEGARIYCGTFDRLPDVAEYDLVVALDGLDRVDGPDDEAPSWADKIRRLRDLLTPDGKVILAVANDLGVQNLVAASPDARGFVSDVAGPNSQERMAPAGLADARLACESARMHVRSTLAAFPNQHTPTLFVPDEMLHHHRSDETLGCLVSQSYQSEARAQRPLKDPRTLAKRALHAGLGLDLSAAWVFCMTRSETTSAAADNMSKQLLVSESEEDADCALRYSLAPSRDGAWSRWLLPSVDSTPRSYGDVTRLPGRINGSVPRGIPLRQQFLNYCATQDVTALRRVLQDYVDWLRDQAYPADGSTSSSDGDTLGYVSGELAFATFDNVSRTDAGMTMVDPTWTFDDYVPLEAVVLRAVRRFANHVVTNAEDHPWPSGSSADRISTSLASMVGIVVNEELRQLAAALEGRLDLRVRPSGYLGGRELLFGAADAQSPAPLGIGGPAGYDEALRTIEHLRNQVSETEAQVEWLIGKIHQKQAQLRRSQRQAKQVKRSREYRLGEAVLARRQKIRFWRRRAKKPAPSTAHLWRPPAPKKPAPQRDPKLLPPGLRPSGGGGRD